MPIIEAKDLRLFLNESPARKLGCLIDTNILFAANFSLDHFHDEAIEIFKTLMDEKVPLYTNVNIRSEFINRARLSSFTLFLTFFATRAQISPLKFTINFDP